MADITWRDVRADLGGTSQAITGASQSMSRAGDIFGRMRELQLSEQKAAQDEAFRQRQLDEQIRQFGVTSGLDREIFGLSERKHGEDIRQFDIEQIDKMLGRQLQLGEGTQEYPEALKRRLGFPTSDVTPSSRSGSTFDLNTLTQDVSNRYGIDPRIMSNLFNAESGGDPNAVSSVGAQGLGQLMPGTARDMGVTDPFNPIQNAEGSAKYLSQMLNRYGNLEDAAAAYNWGPGKMDKYIAGGRTGNMPQETRNFITKVTTGINPQEVSTNYSVVREDAIRRQNDRASILGERAGLVSPMDSTTRATVMPSPTGTPNSPLLGLSNPSQDKIDAMIARGSTPGSDLVKQAETTQKDINEKELKEEKRLFGNDLVFRSMVDSGGDPEDARARYEAEYIAKYGEKPATNPLDRAVELAKKDTELKEKAKAGDEASRKQLYSTLESNYKDFISNRVDPDSKFSYENNITSAVRNSKLFGDDPTKEDALKGVLTRSIVQRDIGDKTGWFFESRNDRYATTAFGISDEASNALQAISNFDPSTQSLEDMTPIMQLMYNNAVSYGLIPREIQNQLSTGTAIVIGKRKEDEARKEAIEETTRNLKAERDKLKTRKENLATTNVEARKEINRRIQEKASEIDESLRTQVRSELGTDLVGTNSHRYFGTDTANRLKMVSKRAEGIKKEKIYLNDVQATNEAFKELRKGWSKS